MCEWATPCKLYATYNIIDVTMADQIGQNRNDVWNEDLVYPHLACVPTAVHGNTPRESFMTGARLYRGPTCACRLYRFAVHVTPRW
jgi:hypothetical protein